MSNCTIPTIEPRDATSDPEGPDGMGTFYRAETSQPDTAALLAEVGMPSHAIRGFIGSRATAPGPTAK